MEMAWMRRGKEGGNGMDEEGKRRWKWQRCGGGCRKGRGKMKVAMAWMKRRMKRRRKWHG